MLPFTAPTFFNGHPVYTGPDTLFGTIINDRTWPQYGSSTDANQAGRLS